MIRIGLIGYGYWGPNLARAAAETDGATVEMIADYSGPARERAAKRHPSARLATDWVTLVQDPKVDAVLIATPAKTHFEIALGALAAGKHVLIEKPLADSPARAARLVDEAMRRSRILMVDHTFVFTGAVKTIQELVANGRLGEIYYYDSTRVNLGVFQRDVNVIWDLAVHDFAIMDFILPARPIAISASAAGFLSGSPENMAHLSVFFDDGALAHLNVNWLAPVKVRQTLIGGSRRMVIYDDMQASEKVKVYDRGASVSDNPSDALTQMVSYRLGDMWAPAISPTEALVAEMREFVRCIDTGERPITDGESGLRVVEMAAAASRSTALRGQPVELNQLRMVS